MIGPVLLIILKTLEKRREFAAGHEILDHENVKVLRTRVHSLRHQIASIDLFIGVHKDSGLSFFFAGGRGPLGAHVAVSMVVLGDGPCVAHLLFFARNVSHGLKVTVKTSFF